MGCKLVPNGGVPWLPEHDVQLMELVKLGLSGSQIAYQLTPPRSRNSVIGRCHRLGLNIKGKNIGKQLAALGFSTKTVKRKTRERKSAILLSGWAHGFMEPEPLPELVMVPSYEAKPERFIEARGCRRPLWGNEPIPLDEKMVCGKPIERESYCSDCAKVMFQKG